MKWFLVISLLLFAGLFAFAKYQFRYVPRQVLAETRLAAPYDVIIVPGIPFNDGEWGWLMKMRVYWAKYLYDEGIAHNIIFSGSAVHSPYVEADIMALYALQLGIPAANIFTENQALHSTENVDYSCIIAGNHCFARLAVATDPFQSMLLKSYLASKNLPIAVLPAVKGITDAMDTALVVIEPKTAFMEGHIPLKDRD